MRSMVEGACRIEANLTADAPSTALRAVPLPRFAGQDRFYLLQVAMMVEPLSTDHLLSPALTTVKQ